MNSKANGTSFKPGNKGGGRPKKTDEERAGYAYLSERTVKAATRLVQLEDSDDEKIALAATVAHLKIVVGDLQREAGKDGESLSSPFALMLAQFMSLPASTRDAMEVELAKKAVDDGPG